MTLVHQTDDWVEKKFPWPTLPNKATKSRLREEAQVPLVQLLHSWHAYETGEHVAGREKTTATMGRTMITW